VGKRAINLEDLYISIIRHDPKIVKKNEGEIKREVVNMVRQR
jgi:hypothetical protein